MSWSKNQKQRERQKRQRVRLSEELSYYVNNTFAEENAEFVRARITYLQRELNNNGIPNTYR